MTAPADKQTRTQPRRPTKHNVPNALMYEMWAGTPVYYKGYRDVLAGKKNVEVSWSPLHIESILLALLVGSAASKINRKNI